MADQQASEPPLPGEEEIEKMLREAARPAEQPRAVSGLAALNPQISLIGDFLGTLSNAPEKAAAGIQLDGFDHGDVDGFRMRAVELLARAAIDPFADALVKLDFSGEGVEMEEAYALFHSYPECPWTKWLQPWQAKVGVFRMSFGAVNRTDGHDLPTVDRPVAIQNFLGHEGLIRPGVSLSRSFELPGQTQGEWTVELTGGEPLGDEPAPAPFGGVDNPLVLCRFSTFREYQDPSGADPTRWWNRWVGCSGRSELELGATAAYTASFDDAAGQDLFSFVQGLDMTWKGYDPRPQSYRSYLVQGELLASQIELPGGSVRGGVGAYALAQARLDRHLFVGLRGDAVQLPEVPGHQFAATAFVTYFLSEFNRVRLQYQFLTQKAGQGARDEVGVADAHTVWIQWVWAIGAHPPEPYYVSPRF